MEKTTFLVLFAVKIFSKTKVAKAVTLDNETVNEPNTIYEENDKIYKKNDKHFDKLIIL